MTNEAPPRRRGRPPKAPQSAPQALAAPPVAAEDQTASQGHTEAPVSLDQTAIVAKQLHTWLSSLSRGSRHA